jgi:hypothetical protein
MLLGKSCGSVNKNRHFSTELFSTKQHNNNKESFCLVIASLLFVLLKIQEKFKSIKEMSGETKESVCF